MCKELAELMVLLNEINTPMISYQMVVQEVISSSLLARGIYFGRWSNNLLDTGKQCISIVYV